jgi:xanthine dehydrogenase YagT iron-sulfur-binding subunit
MHEAIPAQRLQPIAFSGPNLTLTHLPSLMSGRPYPEYGASFMSTNDEPEVVRTAEDLKRSNPSESDPSRREFLQQTVLTCAVASGVPGALVLGPSMGGEPDSGEQPSALRATLQINGHKHELKLDPRTTLVDALRERLGLTGTKKGCDHGQCGACTVLVDGRRVYSCLTLAVMHAGAKVTTIEGLADGDTLHPMQQAFIKHDAFQCGYCTPGQICSAIGLIGEGHAHTEGEIRELMSGNLCRCGAYVNIVAAVQEVQTAKARP